MTDANNAEHDDGLDQTAPEREPWTNCLIPDDPTAPPTYRRSNT